MDFCQNQRSMVTGLDSIQKRSGLNPTTLEETPMRPLSRLIPLATLSLLLASPVWAETLHYRAQLTTASEVPAKSGPGTGTADAMFDTASSRLTYTITYAGLSGPATAAHFHGPASATETAGVVIKLNGNLASPIRGEAVLTHEQAEALEKGLWYVNIHTASNPSGEIRGQLVK
jgi:hypothetical protein